MSGTLRIASLTLALLLLSAAARAGTPTQLVIVTGNNQTAVVGAPVGGVVCVIVMDAVNTPLPGITVTWGGITGGGSLTGETQLTDSKGIATLGSWTLGPTPGPNSIVANSSGLPPVTFNATAIAPGKLTIAAGNNQVITAGTPVTGIVCARVTDSSDRPLPGISVTWGSITGGGSLQAPAQLTDATGVATLGGWTLGPSIGIQTITATSPGLPAIVFTATATDPGAGNNIVIRWDNALLGAIARVKMAPPQASRAMAIVHTCMYDAWAAYDKVAVGTQRGGELRRPESEHTDANKTVAISYAAYRALLDLFSGEKPAFDSLMAALALDPANVSTDTATPAGIGNVAAAAVLAFRAADNSNQKGTLNPGPYSDFTSYSPANTAATLTDPSKWQPLVVAGVTQVFITPHWGGVTPFAIGEQATRKKLMPKACATFPGKKYEQQAAAVLELSANLNDESKTIATYWADGGGTVTPPGKWLQFAQFVSARDGNTIDKDVKLFFALANAEMDAGIACWDCKRRYDSVRPVSAIRFLYNGQKVMAYAGPGKGTQDILGETWQSYIATPPFGEYVSGHSTFSAAGACVLQLFTKKKDFGMSVNITAGSSFNEPGVPIQPVILQWKTFLEAAVQAGISRRFGGIHFQEGDEQGRALGLKVGKLAFKKAQGYFTGKVK